MARKDIMVTTLATWHFVPGSSSRPRKAADWLLVIQDLDGLNLLHGRRHMLTAVVTGRHEHYIAGLLDEYNIQELVSVPRK